MGTAETATKTRTPTRAKAGARKRKTPATPTETAQAPAPMTTAHRGMPPGLAKMAQGASRVLSLVAGPERVRAIGCLSGGPMTPTALAKAGNMDEALALDLLGQFKRSRLVVAIKDGSEWSYSLTEVGRKAWSAIETIGRS